MRRIRYNNFLMTGQFPNGCHNVRYSFLKVHLRANIQKEMPRLPTSDLGQSGVWVPGEEDRHTPFLQTLCV